ncbi:MAG: hypothetical protein GWN86_06960 [Desulfobacterales bacterium]|nr:hypothetical protein [Desulfobacterales bacterium]
MANTWLHVAGDASGVAFDGSAPTQYNYPFTGLLNLNHCGSGNNNAVEVRDRVGFQASNQFVRVTQYSCCLGASTATRVDDDVAGDSLTVCATGTFSQTCNDCFASGSLINMRFTTGVGGGHGDTVTITAHSMTLADTCCGCKSLLVSHGTDVVQGRGTACCPLEGYTTIAGGLGDTVEGISNEVDVEYIIRHASTFSDMRVYVSGNTIDSCPCKTNWRFQDDSGLTCLSLSVCACTTGEFEDTTNTACVASGSTINYRLRTFNSGMSNDEIAITTASIYQDGVGHNVVASRADPAVVCIPNLNSTRYYTLEGQIAEGTGNAVICDSEICQPIAWQATNLFVRVTAISGAKGNTIALAQNGTVSCLSTGVFCATGTHEDTTSTICLAACDCLAWYHNNCSAGGSQTINISYIGLELQQPASDTSFISAAIVPHPGPGAFTAPTMLPF